MSTPADEPTDGAHAHAHYETAGILGAGEVVWGWRIWDSVFTWEKMNPSLCALRYVP